ATGTRRSARPRPGRPERKRQRSGRSAWLARFVTFSSSVLLKLSELSRCRARRASAQVRAAPKSAFAARIVPNSCPCQFCDSQGASSGWAFLASNFGHVKSAHIHFGSLGTLSPPLSKLIEVVSFRFCVKRG